MLSFALGLMTCVTHPRTALTRGFSHRLDYLLTFSGLYASLYAVLFSLCPKTILQGGARTLLAISSWAIAMVEPHGMSSPNERFSSSENPRKDGVHR